MKNNESGEFELVLGNRQLLSGFFIIVILFGVFFTMGYIVGRNSAPSPRLAAENAAPAAEGRPQPALGNVIPPAAAAPEKAESAASQNAEAPQEPITQPAREPEAAKPPEAAASAPQDEPQAEPEAGQTYLQVMAVKRPEAVVVVRTLKDKGFAALMSPGPNDLIRVMVGPFRDVGSLGKAKAELEASGFRPIVRR